MKEEKNEYHLNKDNRFYNPGTHYVAVLSISIVILNQRYEPSILTFLYSLLFLVPFIIFSIYETYLYMQHGNVHTSIEKRKISNMWFELFGCVLICMIPILLGALL